MINTQTAAYRICTRCIMDTSDPDITFDEQGVCNRCKDAEARRAAVFQPDRQQALEQIVEQIKREGKNLDYDCVIGVSGGVDSTYAAYITYQLGLRPLAVHLDNGWNTELAVSNIENCLKSLSIDLYTYVMDWDEFKDLQSAFLKASTPDSEIPTDHAIVALLRRKAAEFGTRYIIMGTNVATESVNAPAWSRGHGDWKYVSGIHKMYGCIPLKTFPHLTLMDTFYFRVVKRQQFVQILNYVDYNKQRATTIITKELKWVPYSGKHHESIYTRFYQSYILPRKFGFDKRRMHLSDLIISGEITREQALQQMEEEYYPPDMMRNDKIFVAKKLGFSEQEFDAIMALPPKSFFDYPSYTKAPYFTLLKSMQRTLLKN